MKTLAILLSICLASPAIAPAAANTIHKTVNANEQIPAPAPQPLTEDEARDLAKRSEEPGKEVAGGALSNLHLTYIVIALATAVIVIIAVQ
jgi:hypothetical protein